MRVGEINIAADLSVLVSVENAVDEHRSVAHDVQKFVRGVRHVQIDNVAGADLKLREGIKSGAVADRAGGDVGDARIRVEMSQRPPVGRNDISPGSCRFHRHKPSERCEQRREHKFIWLEPVSRLPRQCQLCPQSTQLESERRFLKKSGCPPLQTTARLIRLSFNATYDPPPRHLLETLSFHSPYP